MKKSALILGVILSILAISGVLALIDINNLPQVNTGGNQINTSNLPVLNTSGNQINTNNLPVLNAGGAVTTQASKGLPLVGWIVIIVLLAILIALMVIIILRVLKKPVQTKK